MLSCRAVQILVTGGGGFLGEHIVRRLLEEGHLPRVLGRSRYPALEALGVPCVQGDVADPEAAARAVEGIEVVYHVASKAGYWGPHEDYVRTNVGGARALLDAAQAAGVSRFVYTSSPSVVIGDRGLPLGADEALPYPERYLSSYGPTKAEAERMVLAAHGPGFSTAALRPHFIFGPGDRHVVPRLIAHAKAGTIAQVGDGANQVDVSYIDNVVDAHLQLEEALREPGAAAGGKTYFIGQERPVELWDFVAQVLAGVGAPPVKRKLPFKLAYAIGWILEGVYRLRPPEQEPPMTRMAAVMLGSSHAFSHARAAEDFGYAPRVKLQEAIARTVRAFKEGEG